MTKIRNQQQLVEAAAKVFAEKGYAEAQVKDVAAELGVLQGSIYYHVASKADLLRMVRVARFRAISERIEAIAQGEGTTHDKLQQAVTTQLRHIEQFLEESVNWFLVPAERKKAPEIAAEDSALTAHYREQWRVMLAQGVASGEIRAGLDLTVTVLTILGALNWTAQWFERDGPRTIDEIAATQFDLIWASLTV